MNLAEAIARAEPRIRGALTHPDYDHVVAYAAKLKQYETGDVASRLRRYVLAESEQQFQSRVNLTVTTVPAVWSEWRTPFKQVSRLKGNQVEQRFDYDGVSDAEQVRRKLILQQLNDTYYQGKSIAEFVADQVVGAVAINDPNAWLLTEFKPFDFRTERARPYPVILPSSAIVDFTDEAGNWTSVTARTQVSQDGVTGWRYTMYLANESVDYWPVLYGTNGAVYTLPEGSAAAGVLVDEHGLPVWQYRILQHRAGRVPATRLGYVLDAETDRRTCVSPLHPALCFLEKALHLDSELDINLKRTINPHKSMFVPACPGIAVGSCVAGKDPTTQHTCGICHGTQQSPVQESAMEVVTFPLPRDLEELGKMPDLSKMVHFERPPIEIAEFQLKFTDYLVARGQRTLFNTDTLSKATVVTTATERLAEAAQKNTALSPMADFISSTIVYHTYVMAGYADVADSLNSGYKFPYELVAVELADLLTVYKEARGSGADAMFLQNLYVRLTERELADNPEGLKQFRVKQRFVPYIGCTDDYVLKLAALGKIPDYKFVLRTEQDSIFYELERDSPGFFDMAPAKQQPLVDAKVQALVLELPAAKAATGAFSTPNFSAAAVA